MTPEKVFLVCEWVHTEEMTDRTQPHIEMIGVFSTEEKAVNACLTEHHFYGEFDLDRAELGTDPWKTKNPFPKKA